MKAEIVFPSYKSYKDSGIEWLPQIPAHWSVSRLGFEAWVRARLGWKGLKAEEYVNDGFALLATPNIKGALIDFENVNFINKIRFDESPEIKLRVNDVLLAKDGSTLGTANVVRELPKPATVNSSIAVITPASTLNGVYLFRLFQSDYMQNVIQRIKGGMGVPHLFQEDLVKFYIPLPPMAEQQALVAFLDRETSKIDKLIEKQERLIDLLTEKRQAVISHFVVKGIDPNTPMKDSGVEWIGKVPRHWEVSKFVRYVYISEGQVDPESDHFKDMVLIAPNHIESGTGKIILLETAKDQQAESGKYLCPAGCVIYSKIRPALRKVCVAPLICLCSADMYPLTPRKNLTASYLHWYMLCEEFSTVAVLESERVAMPKINRETLKNLALLVPPYNEQISIISAIEKELTKIDKLIDKAKESIALMKEHRSSLISAAVTGKIDVRGIA